MDDSCSEDKSIGKALESIANRQGTFSAFHVEIARQAEMVPIKSWAQSTKNCHTYLYISPSIYFLLCPHGVRGFYQLHHDTGKQVSAFWRSKPYLAYDCSEHMHSTVAYRRWIAVTRRQTLSGDSEGWHLLRSSQHTKQPAE